QLRARRELHRNRDHLVVGERGCDERHVERECDHRDPEDQDGVRGKVCEGAVFNHCEGARGTRRENFYPRRLPMRLESILARSSHSRIQALAVSASMSLSSHAMSDWVKSSAREPRAKKKNRTASRSDPRSFPSAILLGTLTADRRSWSRRPQSRLNAG